MVQTTAARESLATEGPSFGTRSQSFTKHERIIAIFEIDTTIMRFNIARAIDLARSQEARQSNQANRSSQVEYKKIMSLKVISRVLNEELGWERAPV